MVSNGWWIFGAFICLLVTATFLCAASWMIMQVKWEQTDRLVLALVLTVAAGVVVGVVLWQMAVREA